jgi:hypothetical protein
MTSFSKDVILQALSGFPPIRLYAAKSESDSSSKLQVSVVEVQIAIDGNGSTALEGEKEKVIGYWPC